MRCRYLLGVQGSHTVECRSDIGDEAVWLALHARYGVREWPGSPVFSVSDRELTRNATMNYAKGFDGAPLPLLTRGGVGSWKAIVAGTAAVRCNL